MTLGQKIKKLRNEKGLTQKDLADQLHVTFQTVSKWEKDENEPDISTLRELAKLFECSMDSQNGIRCICHPLIDCDVPNNGKIILFFREFSQDEYNTVPSPHCIVLFVNIRFLLAARFAEPRHLYVYQ